MAAQPDDDWRLLPRELGDHLQKNIEWEGPSPFQEFVASVSPMDSRLRPAKIFDITRNNTISVGADPSSTIVFPATVSSYRIGAPQERSQHFVY